MCVVSYALDHFIIESVFIIYSFLSEIASLSCIIPKGKWLVPGYRQLTGCPVSVQDLASNGPSTVHNTSATFSTLLVSSFYLNRPIHTGCLSRALPLRSRHYLFIRIRYSLVQFDNHLIINKRCIDCKISETRSHNFECSGVRPKRKVTTW